MATKSARTNLRIDARLAEQIKEVATKEDVPEAQIARRWLRKGRDACIAEEEKRAPPKRA